MGDFDGDGLSDIVYYGTCGSLGLSCWRLHRSDGTKFRSGENWGNGLFMSTETASVVGLLVGDFESVADARFSFVFFLLSIFFKIFVR